MIDHYWLGIDISLRSPAFALLTPQGNWYILAFAQSTSQYTRLHNTLLANHRITLATPIPMLIRDRDKTCVLHNVKRFDYIVYTMQIWLNTYVPDIQHLRVCFEGYAFSKITNAFSTTLHELCGVIQLRLFQLGVRSLHTITPSTWKVRTVGTDTGRNKYAAVEYVRTHGPQVDLLTLFGHDVTTITPKKCPHPIQDIADAIGVLLGHRQSIHGV